MTVSADSQALDVLCPMHLVLDASGNILHAGPTIEKMCPGRDLKGRRFLDFFDVERPHAVSSMRTFKGIGPQKLHLKLRDPPYTALKGIVVHAGKDGEQLIVNLSFGISIVDGVRDFALTNADFAATDLAIEMLYLVEAKTAAMEASYRLNTRLQGAKIAAEEQAYTDILTGLKNRRALNEVLNRMIEAGSSFAVMHIDLDYFKSVNDSFGHAAGDHVLKTVARIMLDETRKQDLVARVGGDEFTVVLPDVQSKEVLRGVGRRIIERLEDPLPFQGQDCRISASIGTVWVQNGDAPKLEDLLSDADVALYASKNAGRATQTIYTPELRDAANAVVLPQVEKDQIA